MQSDDEPQQPMPATVTASQQMPQWLHPLSPAFDVLSMIRSSIIPFLFGGYAAFQGRLVGFLVIFLIFVSQLIYALVKYLALRYQLRDQDLIVDEGIIFKKHRTIPVHRIQNIDLKQNILHRLLSVAEVRIETASGSEPEAILRVLSLDQVNALRRNISTLRSQSPVTPQVVQGTENNPKPVPEALSETLLKIDTLSLAFAGLLSNRGILLLGVLIGIVFQGDWWRDRDSIRSYFDTVSNSSVFDSFANQRLIIALLIAIAALFGFLTIKLFSIAWYIIRFYGYQLSQLNEELHIKCGLFTQLSATIPRKRIQLISVQQTVLQRYFKLATIRIETAGGAGKADDATSSIGRRWFVPVISQAQVPSIVHRLRNELNWNVDSLDWKPLSMRASRRMQRVNVLLALFATLCAGLIFRPWGVAIGFVLVPFAIWHARRRARSLRYGRANSQVFFKSGVLTMKLSTTFLEKAQAITVYQSPFDRRWDMATLAVDTAGVGPADHSIKIRMLDSQFAFSELNQLSKEASQQQLQLS